jgi:putative oxidoreductase
LLLLRIVLGAVFVAHGLQKLFVFGLAGVAGMLGSLGLPLPALNAVLVTAAELGGGLLLLSGAATRVTAAILAFTMGVAIMTVHLSHGFFAPAGVEYPLTLLVANLALVMTGAGRYSVDALFNRHNTRGVAPEHSAATVLGKAA